MSFVLIRTHAAPFAMPLNVQMTNREPTLLETRQIKAKPFFILVDKSGIPLPTFVFYATCCSYVLGSRNQFSVEVVFSCYGLHISDPSKKRLDRSNTKFHLREDKSERGDAAAHLCQYLVWSGPLLNSLVVLNGRGGVPRLSKISPFSLDLKDLCGLLAHSAPPQKKCKVIEGKKSEWLPFWNLPKTHLLGRLGKQSLGNDQELPTVEAVLLYDIMGPVVIVRHLAVSRRWKSGCRIGGSLLFALFHVAKEKVQIQTFCMHFDIIGLPHSSPIQFYVSWYLQGASCVYLDGDNAALSFYQHMGFVEVKSHTGVCHVRFTCISIF